MNAQLVRVREGAENFPLSLVRDRYCLEQKVEADVAKLHEREVKRYLYLCAINPGERWPMVNSIDEFWHTFLIFTREYQDFCGSLGVPFIHHEPFTGEVDVSAVQPTYDRFLERYRENFGTPPAEIWPKVLGHGLSDCASCGSGCSGGGCSGIGCGATCGSSCR